MIYRFEVCYYVEEEDITLNSSGYVCGNSFGECAEKVKQKYKDYQICTVSFSTLEGTEEGLVLSDDLPEHWD